jgi:hypothetical protein
VELREPDGRATVRRVSGETCSEVVAALALVTAVMVDPDALTEPIIRGASWRRVEPAVSAPPAPPPKPRPWRFGLLGGASLQTAAAPEPLLVYAAEIEVLPAPGWLPEPALALSLHRGRSDRIEAHGGQAEFAWTSGRLSACPTRWPARAPAAFRLCLSLDVGALRGTGSGVGNPASPGARCGWPLAVSFAGSSWSGIGSWWLRTGAPSSPWCAPGSTSGHLRTRALCIARRSQA